jgi:DNA processing protein
LSALNPTRAVAFVGTREPSDYGRKAGEKLALLLTQAGLNIVSGLAIGCDTIGHRACLDSHGQTVAVLAGGLDHIYPKENKGLASEILDKGGCWLAEHPVGVRPQSNFFVERDRLQSGLSDGVVVLETDVKGGTMHTVKFTQLQGRTLACFKHPPKYADHPKAQGNQLLLREGKAMPLGSPEEINAFLAHLGKVPEKRAVVSHSIASNQPTLF